MVIARSGASSTLGNCVPNFSWVCSTLNGGSSWIEIEPQVSVAIGADGRPLVAYSEADSYNNQERIKLARILIDMFLPLIRK